MFILLCPCIYFSVISNRALKMTYALNYILEHSLWEEFYSRKSLLKVIEWLQFINNFALIILIIHVMVVIATQKDRNQ